MYCGAWQKEKETGLRQHGKTVQKKTSIQEEKERERKKGNKEWQKLSLTKSRGKGSKGNLNFRSGAGC